MQLEKKLVSSGYWLFRWRSYFPIIIILIFIPAMTEYEYVGGSREMTTMWGLFSMFVGLLGLFSRILVVGHTPQNTSGRNTRDLIPVQFEQAQTRGPDSTILQNHCKTSCIRTLEDAPGDLSCISGNRNVKPMVHPLRK